MATEPEVDSPADHSTGPAETEERVSRKRDSSTAPSAREDSEGPAKRKKLGGRGVANLTPDQLAKKRANDREAQRAIRERTKNQIDTLERRIQELTSQKPYLELQAVVRAKEAVERENADIKRRLASIVGMLQPLIGAAAIEGAYVSPAQTHAAAATAGVSKETSGTMSAHSASTPSSMASPSNTEQTGLQTLAGAADHAKTQLSQQQYDLRHGLDLGPERLGLGFLLDTGQRVTTIQAGVNGAQDSNQYHHVPMKHDWTATSHEQAFKRDQAGWFPPKGRGADDQFEDQAAGIPGEHAQPSRNVPPTCPLDSLLLDFLGERRQRMAEGISPHEVVGPRYPSVSSLLNPSNSVYSHPLSKVFTDILSTFPDLSSLPERVAVLYIMFLFMRWQISPTRENYQRLPEWIRPRPSQLFTQHPAWIDHVPWPCMRDRLVASQGTDEYPFDCFFIPFTTTLTLSWPYEETDTLLKTTDTEEVVINPVFERHLRNLDNWKLGEAFVKTLPSLSDTCNLDEKAALAYRAMSER